MLKVPALGLDVVVLANRGDLSASLITQQILSACIPSLPAPVVAATHQTVSGMFRSTRSGRVLRLLVREGRQICSSGAGSGVPMEADAEGVLRPAEGSDVLRESVMLLGSPENPSALRFTSFGNTDELQRLPEAQTHGAEVTGCFRSPAIGTEVTVQRGDRGLQMKTVGRFGTVTYDMEALAERTWQCRSSSAAFLGGIVHFDADAQRFCFSNYSSPVLPFVRSR
jgi:hypothetical protein